MRAPRKSPCTSHTSVTIYCSKLRNLFFFLLRNIFFLTIQYSNYLQHISLPTLHYRSYITYNATNYNYVTLHYITLLLLPYTTSFFFNIKTHFFREHVTYKKNYLQYKYWFTIHCLLFTKKTLKYLHTLCRILLLFLRKNIPLLSYIQLHIINWKERKTREVKFAK